jgi:hypothetical protein
MNDNQRRARVFVVYDTATFPVASYSKSVVKPEYAWQARMKDKSLAL